MAAEVRKKTRKGEPPKKEDRKDKKKSGRYLLAFLLTVVVAIAGGRYLVSDYLKPQAVNKEPEKKVNRHRQIKAETVTKIEVITTDGKHLIFDREEEIKTIVEAYNLTEAYELEKHSLQSDPTTVMMITFKGGQAYVAPAGGDYVTVQYQAGRENIQYRAYNPSLVRFFANINEKSP